MTEPPLLVRLTCEPLMEPEPVTERSAELLTVRAPEELRLPSLDRLAVVSATDVEPEIEPELETLEADTVSELLELMEPALPSVEALSDMVPPELRLPVAVLVKVLSMIAERDVPAMREPLLVREGAVMVREPVGETEAPALARI